jgi:hypothetical protein
VRLEGLGQLKNPMTSSLLVAKVSVNTETVFGSGVLAEVTINSTVACVATARISVEHVASIFGVYELCKQETSLVCHTILLASYLAYILRP